MSEAIVSLGIGIAGSIIAWWLVEKRQETRALCAQVGVAVLHWLSRGCPVFEARLKIAIRLALILNSTASTLAEVADWLRKKGSLLFPGIVCFQPAIVSFLKQRDHRYTIRAFILPRRFQSSPIDRYLILIT